MTLDRATILLSLVEASKALSAAHAAARRMGDVELATYIADLAADCYATMCDVSKRRDERMAVVS